MPSKDAIEAAITTIEKGGETPTAEKILEITGGSKPDVLRLRAAYMAERTKRLAEGGDLSPEDRAAAFSLVRLMRSELERDFAAAREVDRRHCAAVAEALELEVEALKARIDSLEEERRTLRIERDNLATDLGEMTKRFEEVSSRAFEGETGSEQHHAMTGRWDSDQSSSANVTIEARLRYLEQRLEKLNSDDVGAPPDLSSGLGKARSTHEPQDARQIDLEEAIAALPPPRQPISVAADKSAASNRAGDALASGGSSGLSKVDEHKSDESMVAGSETAQVPTDASESAPEDRAAPTTWAPKFRSYAEATGRVG